MLLKIRITRTGKWFAETSAGLTATVNAKTNVQVPYRLPLIERTHDPHCKLKVVQKKTTVRMSRKMHQAQKMS